MEIFIYAILVSIADYGWFFIFFFEILCQDNVLRHSDLTAEFCFKRYLKLNVLIYMLSLYLFYDNLGLLYSKRNACMHIRLSSVVGDVFVFCYLSLYNILK